MTTVYLQEKFDKAFAVTKDLHSVRTKGTMQEDLLKEVIDKHNLKQVDSKTTSSDFLVWNEVMYANADGTIGAYYGTCRMGIPAAYIGVANNKLWTDVIRKDLRAKGLAR